MCILLLSLGIFDLLLVLSKLFLQSFATYYHIFTSLTMDNRQHLPLQSIQATYEELGMRVQTAL